jgi:uncharacterized tellurite resistance protein B-like protein
MRPYPTNSPEAAARIVTLALLADGHLDRAELDALEARQVHATLGLDRDAMQNVLLGLCEDLLSSMHLTWSEACRIDPRTLAQLMDEIDDPALQRTVLGLCVAVVEADDHVADGESVLLVAAVEHWGLQREMFAAAPMPT